MKKPTPAPRHAPLAYAKLIAKLQKENAVTPDRLPPQDALKLARSAALQQEYRVSQLIQEINK